MLLNSLFEFSQIKARLPVAVNIHGSVQIQPVI